MLAGKLNTFSTASSSSDEDADVDDLSDEDLSDSFDSLPLPSAIAIDECTSLIECLLSLFESPKPWPCAREEPTSAEEEDEDKEGVEALKSGEGARAYDDSPFREDDGEMTGFPLPFALRERQTTYE